MSNPLLDLMRRGESGAAGYNAYNRGTYVGSDGREHIRGADRDIDFSRLTLGQVQDLQHAGRQDPDRLFAVGKYQIIPATMDGAVRNLHLGRDTRFTPELQDRIFSEYLIVGKRPAIHDYITGQNGATLQQAQHSLSLEWASFGDPSKGGRSHYGGANRASITLEQSAAALNQMRNDYQRDIAAGMTPDAAWRAVTSAGQAQAQTPQAQAQTPATPSGTARTQAQNAQAGSFQDAMNVMLPPQDGVRAHTTGHFGEGRAARPGVPAHGHAGTDFNYAGGQSGINMRHPEVHSPVSGTVEIVRGSQFNTVGIRDAQGNLHQFLHLNAQRVQNGQHVNAGDVIGTMGNKGPAGTHYPQHVHYQIHDRQGHAVDPERFWNGRTLEAPGARTQGAGANRGGTGEAQSGGVLRNGSTGPDVEAVQRQLAGLGYVGRDGKPLQPDGKLGDDTAFAISAYQRAHGLGIDGKVGEQTRTALAASREHPLLGEATHPAHGLYAAFAERLPNARPEALANLTMQATENGITSRATLGSVDVNGDNVFVRGSNPVNRFAADLQAPTASLQQISDHVADHARKAAQPAPVQTQAQTVSV